MQDRGYAPAGVEVQVVAEEEAGPALQISQDSLPT